MAIASVEMLDAHFEPKVRQLGMNHAVTTEMNYYIEDMTERLHIMYRFDERQMYAERAGRAMARTIDTEILKSMVSLA